MTDQKEARRQELYDLMGDLPPRDRKISARITAEEEHPGYLLQKILLDLNGIEDVTAYFVKPKNAAGPMPGILFNHSHSEYDIGKEELLYKREFPTEQYAEFLTQMGYCALCIDTWAFGERRGKTESEIFKQMLWQGQVMWGMMVYDNLRALDYLISRPEVDPARIATTGMSMGSTMSWWTAALDTRIKVCLEICCLTDFDALLDTRNLDGHGIYYYVPRLLKHFTAGQINALISPRYHLSLNGDYDKLTPPAGLDRIDAELRKVYAEDGAPDAWKLIRYKTGHIETFAMRQDTKEYLRKWL